MVFGYIQSLRALSIVFVIIYHFNIGILGGGFLGVDMFFVISGFVITKSILTRFQEDKFSFFDFFTKRIKRILPALFVMLFVSFCVFYFISTELEYKALLKYAKPDLIPYQISNFVFAYQKLDYWDTQTEHIFLHTWSLSVEEQFYLIYPIIFILCLKYFKNIQHIIIVFIGLIAISLFFFLTLEKKIGFYMPHARAFAFLLGGIAYLMVSNKDSIIKGSIRRKIIYGLFYLCIVSILLFIANHNSILHKEDNIIIAILTFGVLVCGYYVKENKYIVNKVYSYIGDRSYSLYLWHFPIIIMGSIFVYIFNYNAYLVIILLPIIIIISHLSYKFIEQPFLKLKTPTVKGKIILTLGAIFIAISISLFIQQATKNRPTYQVKQLGKEGDLQFKYRLGVSEYVNNNSKYNMVSLSPSWGQTLNEIFIEIAKQNNLNLYMFAHSGCYIFSIMNNTECYGGVNVLQQIQNIPKKERELVKYLFVFLDDEPENKPEQYISLVNDYFPNAKYIILTRPYFVKENPNIYFREKSILVQKKNFFGTYLTSNAYKDNVYKNIVNMLDKEQRIQYHTRALSFISVIREAGIDVYYYDLIPIDLKVSQSPYLDTTHYSLYISHDMYYNQGVFDIFKNLDALDFNKTYSVEDFQYDYK